MNPNPLVTIIILSYENYHFIYEALDSVISQDYSNIEIIISNDGSNDFDKTAIIEFLKKNRKSNIKKIVINNNPKNLGTVKNINKAIKLSTGEYIAMFAADDTIFDNKVISKFVDKFKELPKKELIITSQIGMYDTKLKKLIQLFISNDCKEKLKKLSPKKLFSEMAVHCFIPGSGTVYKREIFKKYKLFDEKYQLVEDYSSSLKLLRLGVKYNFLDIISFKHRDGGVSHGNIAGSTLIGKKYEMDILNIMENEIVPYLSSLNSNQQNKFHKIYQNRKWDYTYKYLYKNSSLKEKFLYLSTYQKILIPKLINQTLRSIYGIINRNALNLIILGILMYSVYRSNLNYRNDFSSLITNKWLSTLAQKINHFIGLLGIALIPLSLIAKTAKPIYIKLKIYEKQTTC